MIAVYTRSVHVSTDLRFLRPILFQTGFFPRGLSGYLLSLRTGLPALYWIHYKTMKKQTATETRE